MRAVFISWAPHCSRSDNIAREFGATSYMVYNDRWGSRPLTIIFKYLWQLVETFKVLSREKADVAFVMTPPVFAGLALYLYSWFRPLQYVVDVHTAALLMPRWQRMQWLQRFVCKRATTTMVTNDHLGSLISAGGGHTTIVLDVPVQYPCSKRFEGQTDFTVAVICSFNYDEPIDQMLKAAAQLPDVKFLFTGDPTPLDPSLRHSMPPNTSLTGFLSSEDYGSLLTHADAVMSLTTRDHTMLRGAYEAIYQGTPVVVSNWNLLKSAFDEGAEHVENHAASIAEGISRIKADAAGYRAAALRLRRRKLARWAETQKAISARLAARP
jgi:glycosyltransferase involved in cell wall biosynthesis